jgi:hypothetical protein
MLAFSIARFFLFQVAAECSIRVIIIPKLGLNESVVGGFHIAFAASKLGSPRRNSFSSRSLKPA